MPSDPLADAARALLDTERVCIGDRYSTVDRPKLDALRDRLAEHDAALSREGTPPWADVYETLAGLVDGEACEWRGDYCMAHGCKGHPCDNAAGRDLLTRIAPLLGRPAPPAERSET